MDFEMTPEKVAMMLGRKDLEKEALMEINSKLQEENKKLKQKVVEMQKELEG